MRSQLILSLALCAAPAVAQSPRPNTQVDATGGLDGAIVATDGVVSAIVFVESSTHDVYVSTSDHAGVIWSDAVRVDDDTTGAMKRVDTTSVVVHDGVIFASWTDARLDGIGSEDVFFSFSSDGGVTWSPNKRIATGILQAVDEVKDWRMAASAGTPNHNVFFLISVENNGESANEELFFVANDQAGAQDDFLAPVALADWHPTPAFDTDAVDMVAVGDTCYACWSDDRSGVDDTWLDISSDRGQTWDADIQVDDPLNTASDTQNFIDLDVSGSTIAIGWLQEDSGVGPESLHTAISKDDGGTFTRALVGNYTAGTDDVDAVGLEIDDSFPDNVIVVWNDDRSGQNEVFTSSTLDGGLSWSETPLSTDGGEFPLITYDPDGTAGLIWKTQRFPRGVDAAYSTDSGVSWTMVPEVLTTADANEVDAVYIPSVQNFLFTWLFGEPGEMNVQAGGYSLCVGAATASRNAGTNPESLTATAPLLGGTLTCSVDLSTTGHNLAVVLGYGGALSLTLGGGQVLLTDVSHPGGEAFAFVPTPGPIADFAIGIPNDPRLCGSFVAMQAIHIGGVKPFALSNAQDLTASSF